MLLDFQFVGVDGGAAAGELFQAAGVVEVQVAQDDRADVLDAIADRCQRVVEVVFVVVEVARERFPRGSGQSSWAFCAQPVSKRIGPARGCSTTAATTAIRRRSKAGCGLDCTAAVAPRMKKPSSTSMRPRSSN